MITYEDYVNGSSPNLNDKSDGALRERGRYLVEVVDKVAPVNDELLLKYKDEAQSLDKNRIVIPFSPSAGKTTAVRQLIVNNVNSTGVYSSKLLDDLDKLEYDVKAHYKYLGETPVSITKFTSRDNPSIDDLSLAQWIFCTHARLMIEPSSILTTYSANTLAVSMRLPRNYFIVDEYPSNVYYYTTAKSVRVLYFLDERMRESSKDTDRIAADIQRNAGYTPERSKILAERLLRTNMILRGSTPDSSIASKEMLRVAENFGTPKKSDTIDVLSNEMKLSPENNDRGFRVERMSFFMSHFVKKYKELLDTGKEISDSTRFYYSLSDLAEDVPLIVLDGTGDLTLGKLPNWYLPEPTEFTTRKMKVDKFSFLELYDKRNNDKKDIVNSYVEVLTNISKEHPNEKILAYMWKFTKGNTSLDDNDEVLDDSPELKDTILNILSENGINNVSIITYMSGEEKGTNQYRDHSVAVVLGEFFVPGHVINDMSNSMYNHPNTEVSYLSSSDYTLSLIIQFLYRTSARDRFNNKGISIYMDHRYDKLARKLFEVVQVEGIDISKELPTLSSDSVTRMRVIKLNELVESGGLYYDEGTNSYYGTSGSLSSALGCYNDKRRIMKKLEGLGLGNMRVTSGVRVPGVSNGKFTVYILSLSNGPDEELSPSELSSIIRVSGLGNK